MRHRWMGPFLLSVLVVGMTHLNAFAAFSPLFQVREVTGECSAETDGVSKTLTGGEGLAFGTVLRTSAGGGMTVLLSQDNTVNIGGDAIVVIGEESPGSKLKIIRVHQGKVNLDLDKEFEVENGVQVVTRCVAVNVQMAGKSSVEATREADLFVVVINCLSGQLDATGPDFVIPLLKENDGITIACSKDRGFIRLRCLTGKFGVQIADSDGNDRIAEMVPDSVIKILRKKSDTEPSEWIVTILEVDKEGNVINATTTTEPGDSALPPLLDDETTPPEDAVEPAKSDPEATFPSTSSSTTTSTSTTTTTKPPITFSGRR